MSGTCVRCGIALKGTASKCPACTAFLGLTPDEKKAYVEFFEALAPVADPVYHPAHYKAGGLEVIDIIEAFSLSFNRGQVAKYLLRAGKKDVAKECEDLEKAAFYLQREIRTLKKL